VRLALVGLVDMGYAKLLERQPGQREARWAHLMCGEPKAPAREARAYTPPPPTGADHEARITALEARVAELEARIASDNDSSR
jgi:uncharacterized protein